MRSICVFCGSRTGNRPEYVAAARALGQLLASRNIELVYGGGSIGLMGEIGTAVMEAKGKVVGVIPKFLDELEVGHQGITRLVLVESMHERKQMMESLSEGVIAMPGGFGTLEELTEIITWAQLNLVKKPIGLLNVGGYYDPFLRFLDHMVQEDFVSQSNRELLIAADTPEALLAKMEDFQAEGGAQKIKRSET